MKQSLAEIYVDRITEILSAMHDIAADFAPVSNDTY